MRPDTEHPAMSTLLQRATYVATYRRALDIMLKPRETWAVIAGENWGLISLATGYVLITAATPIVCNAVMALLNGFGVSTVLPLYAAFLARNVVATLAAGVAAGWLAGQMGLELDREAGLKLVAFSATAIFAVRLVAAFAHVGLPMEFIGYAGFIYLACIGTPILARTAAAGNVPLFAGGLVLCFYVVTMVLTSLVAPAASGGRISEGEALQMGAMMQQNMHDQWAAQRCTMGVGYGCGNP